MEGGEAVGDNFRSQVIKLAFPRVRKSMRENQDMQRV